MAHMEAKMIGSKIAEARKRMNISQAHLAQGLFISPQAVGKWERGESMPDIITLNRLAKMLGVDLNYFSENFPSTASDMASTAPKAEPTAELPSGKYKSRPGWDMSNGNWLDADFSGVPVKSGSSDKNTMAGTVLHRTSFIDTHIADIVFAGNLEDCSFENCAFYRVIFRKVTLLNTFFKNNRNLKRIRFIDCQADRITYEFLKQGKAVLTGITLLTS